MGFGLYNRETIYLSIQPMGMVHPLVLADKDRHVMYMYMFVND